MPLLPSLPPDVSDESHSEMWHAPTRKHPPTVPLPVELREHCKIYLEERLCKRLEFFKVAIAEHVVDTQALVLLQQTLASSNSPLASVTVPGPSIISLVATLAIHPSLTAPDAAVSRKSVSNLALQYLHHLNGIADPLDVPYGHAFHFTDHRRGGGGRRNHGIRSDNDRAMGSTGDSQWVDEIQSTLASHGSVWSCAQDFWHTVGWTFNCAARYPERWVRWKLWMDLVLKILESDWEERCNALEEAKRRNGDIAIASRCARHSLINQFVGGPELTKNGGLKRMLRSIFAEGTEADLNEFGEVFPDEMKPRVTNSESRFTTKQVNVDEGEYGDYMDEDEEESKGSVSETTTTRAHTHSKTESGQARQDAVSCADAYQSNATKDPEVMDFRRRLLALLSKFSSEMSSDFIDHDRLIDIYEQYMRPLKLSRFAKLIMFNPSASTRHQDFAPSLHIALLQEIIRPLIAASRPPSVQSYFLTQDTMQSAYLPFGAAQNSGNSIAIDNARISLCLEAMLRLLKTHVGLSSQDGKLRAAIEKGIRMRRQRSEEVMESRRRGEIRKQEEIDALAWLQGSEVRMMLLMKMVDDQ